MAIQDRDPSPVPYTVLAPGVVSKNDLVLSSPDSTTIEVVARATGTKGTRFNIQSNFTLDGSSPVLPPEGGSGYTIGAPQNYQVIPPRKLAVGGVPTRPYSINILTKAVNVANPEDTFSAYIKLVIEDSIDHITGLVPIIFIQGQSRVFTPTAPIEEIIDGTKTIYRSTYVYQVLVPDPHYFELGVRLSGPPASLGVGEIHKKVTLEPEPPPVLPDYSAPVEGELEVGKVVNLYGPIQGFKIKAGNSSRHVFGALRVTDTNNTNLVHEAVIDFEVRSEDTLTDLSILVCRNRVPTPLDSLPVSGGAYLFEAGDNDNVEVVVQPLGVPGTQVFIRAAVVDGFSAPPVLSDITQAVSYSDEGTFTVNDEMDIIGFFGVDRKASIIPVQFGKAFRTKYPGGLVQIVVDGVSTSGLGNYIQKNVMLQIAVPKILTGIKFVYSNSQNPTEYLEIKAGTDVNGTITGTGTYDLPFLIPVDAPEQFQAFAIAEQSSTDFLAWVQTGYAYNEDTVSLFYPPFPESWSRAFSGTDRVNVVPSPAAPGTPRLRPPRGDELIIATGGVPVGDPGAEPGYSGLIRLHARAQSVANEDDVLEKEIFIKIVDPIVL